MRSAHKVFSRVAKHGFVRVRVRRSRVSRHRRSERLAQESVLEPTRYSRGKKKLRVAAYIRQGQLCRHCSSKECKDAGTDQEPIEIECPACDGGGCNECTFGMVRIDGCPNAYCREMVPLVELADLFEKGIPPIAGGALDQSAWFLKAVKILSSDESEIKAKAQ
jgi:hypothetical protein